MFIVNLLVMLVGLAMAALGMWLLVSDYLYIGSGWENVSTISCALLFVGFLIIFLGFLACCGAITNSQCLLGMFVISLPTVNHGSGGFSCCVSIFESESLIPKPYL